MRARCLITARSYAAQIMFSTSIAWTLRVSVSKEAGGLGSASATGARWG